jgi:hypothetical protein
MSNLDVANSYYGSQAYDDYCQKFVEQATYGHSNIYDSAIAAWNAQRQNAVAGSINGAKPGDLVYFSPNEGNKYFGHTGIYMGNNQFISATDNGVQYQDLNKWQKSTGQSLLGYVPAGQNAQSLGANLNNNSQALTAGASPSQADPLASYRQTLADQNSGKTIWDDNARAVANKAIAAAQPQSAQIQAPQYNFGQEMDNFRSVWNSTHSTPLASYM